MSQDYNELLFHAIRIGNEVQARRALEHGADPNALHRLGNVMEPLIYMAIISYRAHMAKPNMLKLLLEAGADPNAHNSRNEPMFVYFCEPWCLEVAHLFLEAGADPNAMYNGIAPLHYMCRYAADDEDDEDIRMRGLMIEDLLRHGADINSLSSANFTPLDELLNTFSTSVGRPLLRVLLEHGAQISPCVNESLLKRFIRHLYDIYDAEWQVFKIELMLSLGADPQRGVVDVMTMYDSLMAQPHQERDQEVIESCEAVVRLLMEYGADVSAYRNRRVVREILHQWEREREEILQGHPDVPEDVVEQVHSFIALKHRR